MDAPSLDIVHLIQSAVAPVFLLSGVAATLGVLTNRLARAVDRARVIEERIEKATGEASHTVLKHELLIIVRRARYINAAISLCAISALLVALVVVMLFTNAFFNAHLAPAIALLFVGGMLFLTAAFVAFLIEVRLATTNLRIGVRTGLAAKPTGFKAGD